MIQVRGSEKIIEHTKGYDPPETAEKDTSEEGYRYKGALETTRRGSLLIKRGDLVLQFWLIEKGTEKALHAVHTGTEFVGEKLAKAVKSTDYFQKVGIGFFRKLIQCISKRINQALLQEKRRRT